MTDATSTPDTDTAGKGKMPLIIGLVLALAGGGGGFFAVWTGTILGGADTGANTASDEKVVKDPFGDIAFVEVEPMTISISSPSAQRLLRFRVQLEVPKDYRDDVTKLLPRVVDVLNSYLRALELDDLEDQAALTRLRAQMLRRIQVVTGDGRVNDVLIMEFVLT
jgi:flagellar FliL protein